MHIKASNVLSQKFSENLVIRLLYIFYLFVLVGLFLSDYFLSLYIKTFVTTPQITVGSKVNGKLFTLATVVKVKIKLYHRAFR